MGAVARLSEGLRGVASRAVAFEVATVVSEDPLRVDGYDGDVELRALGWYDPAVGDLVIVARWGNTALCLGGTSHNQAPPPTGSVKAFTAGAATVTVTASGADYVMPKVKTYAPVVGDTVAIVWGQSVVAGSVRWSGVAVGALGASPAAAAVPKLPTSQPAADQPTAGTKVSGLATITAAQNGTWRSGWRTDTTKIVVGPWSGKSNQGYWFYGTKPLAYSSGYRVTKAWVWLHASVGGAFAATGVNLGWHLGKVKLASKPSDSGGAFASPALADNASGWYPVPAAEVQKLITGSVSGLTALPSSPYTTLLGITGNSTAPRDVMSGAIKFEWERTS